MRTRPGAAAGLAKDNARPIDNREPDAENSSALRSKVPRVPNPRAGAQWPWRGCERSGLPPVPACYLTLRAIAAFFCSRRLRGFSRSGASAADDAWQVEEQIFVGTACPNFGFQRQFFGGRGSNRPDA